MKSYCDKSTAKRGFIRMGGDVAKWEASVKQIGDKWIVDDSALPKKAKPITIRRRAMIFPKLDMRNHLTGAKLIQYIKAFDKAHGFRSGNTYHIGGQEVTI